MAGQKPYRLDNHNTKKGIMFILMAAFSFALMSIFVRLSGDLPVMQKSFFRNFFAVIFAGITLMRSGEKFKVQKGSLGDLAGRCMFGTVGLVANFYAIDHLGIADANMLNKMSPFFAMLMSIPLIKEVPGKFDWLAVAVAFTGSAFILKPTAGIASLPAFIGLASGFCAGTAYAFLRKLGNRGERGPVIVFCFSAFSTIVAAPFLIFDYHPMTMMQIIFLLLASLGGLGGQLSITAAYRSAPAKEISVFDYSQVIFAASLGIILFGEVPDRWSLLGYVMIIGVAILRWHFAKEADVKHHNTGHDA